MFFFIATACSFNFSRSVIHDTCSSRKKIELAFDVINWNHPVGSNLFCYRKKRAQYSKSKYGYTTPFFAVAYVCNIQDLPPFHQLPHCCSLQNGINVVICISAVK